MIKKQIRTALEVAGDGMSSVRLLGIHRNYLGRIGDGMEGAWIGKTFGMVGFTPA
jgi:hypothetical protein